MGPQGAIGPMGPIGPIGPVGPQGPAGVGLVTGAVLTMSAGTTPPPGFVKIGTTKIAMLDTLGKLALVDLVVYVKQ